MESTQILVQLLIAGIAYRVWNSLRALEQKTEQEPVSPVQPIQAFGPRLLKRIEECSVRMEPADREFLSRQLAHPDNAVALHAARCLAKSLHPAASQLMFEHVERLDREILKHQALRRLERQDFYEKLAEDSNSNPPKPRPGRDWVSEPLAANGFAVLREYLPTMRAKPSDEELQDALHRLLDDPAESPSLRYHALVSLKELHHPPPLPLVERYLKSHEPLLKRAALDLIGHFGLTHLIPRVEVELLNFHPGVATEAVYTLVALQAVSSVPRMRLIANHRNRLIREAAIWGINALSPAHGKQPKAIDRQIGN